jgi:DnaJ-domain-containing protein 1
VTTEDDNHQFSEKMQRMKAELMINELAQNPDAETN